MVAWALRAPLALSVAAALIGLSAAPAPAAEREYVKYYPVAAAYQGAPENLTEIAARFLGDGARSAEVFDLNEGRAQPNGGSLTDPARLDAGWLLRLPWDAVGAEVRYGPLPGGSPAAADSPSPAPSPAPREDHAMATVGATRSGGEVTLLVLVTVAAAAGAVFLIVRIRRLLRT